MEQRTPGDSQQARSEQPAVTSVTCSSCRATLRIKADHAGKRLKCPKCGLPVAVAGPTEQAPAANAASVFAVAGEPGARAPQPAGVPATPRVARRSKRLRRPAAARAALPGWLRAAGTASALVLAVGLGYFLLRRPPPPPAALPPALASARGPVGEGPQPAAPGKAFTPPSPLPSVPRPQLPTRPEPPLSAPVRDPQDVLARLVRFGRGTIEAGAYAGRPLTGVIVEVEALLPRHTAVFQRMSVTALAKDGNEVPACLLFIVGGRDGLAPTARTLAGSTAPGWVFSVGGSRFDPPGRTLLAGAADVHVEVTAVQEMTVLVQTPPGGREPREVMAALPLHLKTGGIELTFLQNRKVSLAFVFPTAVDGLKSLKLLGQTLPLDAARRDDAVPPVGVAQGVPIAPPGRTTKPAVPVSSATTVFEMIPPPPKEFGGIGAIRNRWGTIAAVAFSADGRLVLGAGGSGETIGGTRYTGGIIGLWDLRTRKQVPLWATKDPIDLKGRSPSFAAATFSADGRRVLCATDGGVILSGEPGGGKKPRLLGEVFDRLLCFFPDGRRALLQGDNNSVLLWDLERKRAIRQYLGHAGSVDWAAVLPDGRRFLSQGSDGTVRLWDVGKTRSLHHFDAARIQAVALAARAPRALFVSSDMAYLWDLDKWAEVRRLSPRGLGRYPTLAPDGRRALFVGGLDHGGDPRRWPYAIRLWDLEAGRELVAFAGHTGEVGCLAFASDGRRFLSGSADGTMRLWDLPNEATLARLAARPGAAPAVPPKAGGPGAIRQLVVGSSGGFSTPTVDFSRDGKRAVSTTDNSLLRVWDLERVKEVRRFNAPLPPGALGASVVLAPDGRHALLWGKQTGLDRDLHLWDLGNGRKGGLLRGHSGRVGCAAFAPDGRRAVSGGRAPWTFRMVPPAAQDFTVILWDVVRSRELRRFPGHTAPVHAVAFSPDGRFILSASGATKLGQVGDSLPGVPGKPDNSLRLWDVKTGQELRRFPGHSEAVLCAAFSPDGRRVLSGAADRILRLFDAHTGKEIRRFTAHTAAIQCVAFSAEGRRALSGGGRGDGSVRLWDVDTGRQLHVFRQGNVNTAPVARVAFHADGRRALSAADGIVTLWRLPAPAK